MESTLFIHSYIIYILIGIGAFATFAIMYQFFKMIGGDSREIQSSQRKIWNTLKATIIAFSLTGIISFVETVFK
jgi:hypothetical protein